MGEKLDLDHLYIKNEDGKFVPFEGIRPLDIVCCDEMTEEIYNSLPQEGIIKFNFVMTKQERRKIDKCFQREANKWMRRVRYFKRQKERARRRKLKNAKYQ